MSSYYGYNYIVCGDFAKIAKSMELFKKQSAYLYNVAYFIVLFLFTFRFISQRIYP